MKPEDNLWIEILRREPPGTRDEYLAAGFPPHIIDGIIGRDASAELAAMRTCAVALLALPADARGRALEWLVDAMRGTT